MADRQARSAQGVKGLVPNCCAVYMVMCRSTQYRATLGLESMRWLLSVFIVDLQSNSSWRCVASDNDSIKYLTLTHIWLSFACLTWNQFPPSVVIDFLILVQAHNQSKLSVVLFHNGYQHSERTYHVLTAWVQCGQGVSKNQLSGHLSTSCGIEGVNVLQVTLSNRFDS